MYDNEKPVNNIVIKYKIFTLKNVLPELNDNYPMREFSEAEIIYNTHAIKICYGNVDCYKNA